HEVLEPVNARDRRAGRVAGVEIARAVGDEDHVPVAERVFGAAPVEDPELAAGGHVRGEVLAVERRAVVAAGLGGEAGAAALEHDEEVAGACGAAEAEAGSGAVAAAHPGGGPPLPV